MMIKNKLIQSIMNACKKNQITCQNFDQIDKKIKGNIKVFSYEAPRVFNKQLAQEFDQYIGKENHIRVVQKRKTKILGWTKYVPDPLTQMPYNELRITYKETGILCPLHVTKEQLEETGKVLIHRMVNHISEINLVDCIRDIYASWQKKDIKAN